MTAAVSIDIPLAPVGVQARVTAFALTTVPIAVLVGLGGGLREPLAGVPGGLLLGLGMLTGLALAALMSVNRLRLEAGVLHLRACGFHHHAVPLDHIDLPAVTTGALNRLGAQAAGARIHGILMPGYRCGWFRRGEGQRALLAVTDPGQVVALPLHDGGALMFSPRDTASALAALRRAHPAPSR